MEARVVDVADSWLRRAEWQPTLFGATPRRLDLLKLQPSWTCAPFRLRVHRNQAFEFVASVLGPFLAFGCRRAEISYSDYDDSLAVAVDSPTDVELVWLDFTRYRNRLSAGDLVSWLEDRIGELRRRSDAPILIADGPALDDAAVEVNERLERLASKVSGVRIVPLSRVLAGLGAGALDHRAARVTGMPLSDAACVLAARALGLTWLPAVLGPRLKAIALDLDNTLYAGVLGEDGPAGLRLSPSHLELQRKLLRLRETGLFLALASRNVQADVDHLFEARTDMPLRPEHFSARSIAFREKATGLREICAALRIGPDAVLFVDDNPGEIALVASELAGIKVLYAGDPDVAARGLDLYPGLHGYPAGRDDALRIADLAAADQRAQAAQAAQSPEDYLRSLQVVLTFATNRADHLGRMAELSNKTNQFNTAFLRLTEAQVARRLADPRCRTTTVALRDRLSDSGIVAILFFRLEEATLVVDEVVISCRALGRNIEHAIVTEALRHALRELPATQVRFQFVGGPRNEPARAFLADYAGQAPGADGATIRWDEARAERILKDFPVAIEGEVGR
jgi:FkbH-like protein